MIIEKNGNLLDEQGIIAHQTNTLGIMGAGVAHQIRKYLLSAEEYKSYTDLCAQKGGALLGEVQFIPLQNGKTIANCFAQSTIGGPETGPHTQYFALYMALQKTANYAKAHDLPVAVPGYMGCGLAGGDWGHVYNNILVPIFGASDTQLTIVYYAPNASEGT